MDVVEYMRLATSPWENDIYSPLHFEILMQDNQTKTKFYLVERWSLHFSPNDPSKVGRQCFNLLKRLNLLQRSMYLLVRLLPAFRARLLPAFHQSNCSDPPSMKFRVCNYINPAESDFQFECNNEGNRLRTYDVRDIEGCSGTLRIRVVHLSREALEVYF